MKRFILEWGLIFSVGMVLSLAMLWVASKFFDHSTYHLRIATSRSVSDDLHVLVGDGDLTLGDHFELDASGKVRPVVIDARTHAADIVRGDRIGQFTFPGLDLHYYRIASDGYLIWSLKLSLLIPGALIFLIAILFRRSLRRVRETPRRQSNSPEINTMPQSRFGQQIDAYLDGPIQLRRAVADMSAAQLEARPVPGKWSTLEVVCHLVDSEQAWCHRMKRVIAEEKPLLIGYDESRFTAMLRYHDHDLKTELTLIEGMRAQMALLLRTLPEVAWARTGVHNERGLITLEEMLQAEVEHVPHHIVHINEKRRALGLASLDD
jgi:hypothetical protein